MVSASIVQVLGRCLTTYDLREKQKLLSNGQSLEFKIALVDWCLVTWCWSASETTAALYVVLEKSHGVRYFLPDSEERTITEELNCVLKPFHRTTTAMSAALYPTLSILSPVLYKLLDIVFKVKEDTPSGKQLAVALKPARNGDNPQGCHNLRSYKVVTTFAQWLHNLIPRFPQRCPFYMA